MTGIKGTKADQSLIDELYNMQKQLKSMLRVILICFAVIIFFMVSGIKPSSHYWWYGIPIGILMACVFELLSKVDQKGQVIKYIGIGSLLIVLFLGCHMSFEIKPLFNGLLWGMFPLYFALNYKNGPIKKFINMWRLAKKGGL